MSNTVIAVPGVPPCASADIEYGICFSRSYLVEFRVATKRVCSYLADVISNNIRAGYDPTMEISICEHFEQVLKVLDEVLG